MHINWQLRRPYLPAMARWFTDVPRLACAAVRSGPAGVRLKRYIAIGEQVGWEIAISVFAAERWKEIKEAWHG